MAYYEAVETFRDAEYPMMQGKVYLDHGGTTIYSKSLIEEFSANMLSNLYGNPHSESDPAQLSGHTVDEIREEALAFFKADPEHFDLVFTANATAAMKLVGDCFQDLATTSKAGSFLYAYHRDAHTSLVGIRELTNGTSHCFKSDEEVEAWLDGNASSSGVPYNSGLPGLFAYPGQSNMTGRRLPLSWTKELRRSIRPCHQNTYSLLDAAALATTTQLDFSDPDAAPDFTAISFYKIFGFPDLGALIIRKKTGHILSWRRFFGGGTINLVTVLDVPFVERKDATLHEALEDGTLPFHNIIALGCAMKVHKRLYGSMHTVGQHTTYLAQRLYHGMSSLRHGNGRPVCVIHTDLQDQPYQDPTTQGATISFSVVRQDGTFVGHAGVEKLANEQGIYLRSGGLCNSGGISHHLRIEPWQFKRAWSHGFRCGGDETETGVINGKPIGVVRASLGAMNTLADIDTFVEFMNSTYVTKAEISLAVEDMGYETPEEVSRLAVQGFVHDEGLVTRNRKESHSHSGGSTETLTSPMAGYDQQRSKLRAHQSQETLRTSKARRRAARLLLPTAVQTTLDESYSPVEQVRFLSLDEDNGNVNTDANVHKERKLRKSKSQVVAHSSEIILTTTAGQEAKPRRGGSFKFWKSKNPTVDIFRIFREER